MATVTHEIATTSTSNVATYASGSFTPAASDLLVAFVGATATTGGTGGGSMTDSQSLGFTRITTAVKNSSADELYLFIANSLASASAMTVTFDCTGDNATGCIIFVAAVSGMTKTGSNASRQTAIQNNQPSSTVPAPTFASNCLTGNPTLGFLFNATNPANMIPPTNWTEDANGDKGYATPTTGGEYIYRNSGFTGTAIPWTDSSGTGFGYIAVELDTSGGGPVTVKPLAALGVG